MARSVGAMIGGMARRVILALVMPLAACQTMGLPGDAAPLALAAFAGAWSGSWEGAGAPLAMLMEERPGGGYAMVWTSFAPGPAKEGRLGEVRPEEGDGLTARLRTALFVPAGGAGGWRSLNGGAWSSIKGRTLITEFGGLDDQGRLDRLREERTLVSADEMETRLILIIDDRATTTLRGRSRRRVLE